MSWRRDSARTNLVALPAVALVLATGALGVQVANGGGDFTPLASADPCVARPVTSQSTGIEGLVERLVLIGVDDAACRLGVTREALTLEIAASGDRSDAQIGALREGLLSAVRRMAGDGSLPPASDLVEEALDSVDLNSLLKAAIRALPDSAVNGVLRTDDVLSRTINDLDLRALLANLSDLDDLEQQIVDAVLPAVTDSVTARVRDLVGL